jgi:hypothetical protein
MSPMPDLVLIKAEDVAGGIAKTRRDLRWSAPTVGTIPPPCLTSKSRV